MGRAPCCDKANVKKGPWSPEEDAKLKSYIEKHGTGGNWIALPQKIGLKRCGKSCRLRWLNYLRPNIKHGGFSEEEDRIICSLYVSIGSRWSIIAAQLPGRTDNDIKNYWNTRLKKKLLGKQRKEHQQHARKLKYGTHQDHGMATRTTTVHQKQQSVPGCFPALFDDHHQSPISNMNMFNNNNIITADDLANPQGILPISPYWSSSGGLYPPIPHLQVPNNYTNQLQSDAHQQQLPPNLNDHTSIRKFLIKLGERLSADVTTTIDHRQFVSHGHQGSSVTNLENQSSPEPAGTSSSTYFAPHAQVIPLDQDHQSNMIISPPRTLLSSSKTSPLITNNYNGYMNLQDAIVVSSSMDDHMIMQGGQGSNSLFPQELEDLMSSNYQQQGNSEVGLEFLDWDHDNGNAISIIDNNHHLNAAYDHHQTTTTSSGETTAGGSWGDLQPVMSGESI